MPRKFKFFLNQTGIKGILNEDQYTFFIIFRSSIRRIKNVSDKIIEKIETHILWSVTIFLKIVAFMRYV